MRPLETGGERVHPAVAAAFPGQHLEQPVVVAARPAGAGRLPGHPVVGGAVQLGPPHVPQLPAHHHVQVEHLADAEQVGGQHGHHVAAVPLAPVPVVDDLVRVRPGPGRSGPDQPGRHRVRVAEQHHRGAPAAAADRGLLEGVAEHRDQPAVRGGHRGAQVGAADPERVGVPGPGQVLDLPGRLDVDRITPGRAGSGSSCTAARPARGPARRPAPPAPRSRAGAGRCWW